MATSNQQIRDHLRRLLAQRTPEQAEKQLAAKPSQRPGHIPGAALITPEAIARRWELLPPAAQAQLLDSQTTAQASCYAHNIENFVGTVKVPIGIAGPLRVNGLFAAGDYYCPLATTEAVLVASYHRGALLITEAGGCAAMLLNEGIARVPAFAFATAVDAAKFILWATEHLPDFAAAAATTTRHGQLADLKATLEGNHVYLHFEFRTGDAAGQNMVTIATEAICAWILSNTPHQPEYWFIEANASGDKKASAQSFMTVRGRKVTADITLPADLIKRRLHATPQRLVQYWNISAIGAVLSGALGIQGHYANGLAALYLACGQDVACIAESAIGITRFDITPKGDLYAAVTLPSLVLGTVGGGTGLPSQQACLEILGLHGTGKVQALAEVAAALCLAGELSIVGALAAGEFTQAHQRLARNQRPPGKGTTR
ncbi:MAG: hydroxymethylglutaryl-CoA reductase [Phycisphaerae bacterium]